MSRSNECLEKFIILTENVLEKIGEIVGHHIPATREDFAKLGKEWSAAVDKLNEEYPDKEITTEEPK